MNRRQSLEKGILSPPGSFLTPSPSPSVHSPRLQPSPSQSPFPQDVVVVSSSNNLLGTSQEQDRKSLTPNRRLSINHISPAGSGIVTFRPSPTQSPANIVNVGNEFNTTLIGSNNISLNKQKGKRTPQHNNQYVSQSNNSPKTTKKILGGMGSPVASPSPSPTLNSQQVVQQIPMMNANSSIVFMQQPMTTSQRSSIIQSSNTQQSNVLVSNSNTGTVKQNKTPQQILPKPMMVSTSGSPPTNYTSTSIVSNTSSTRQVMAQSKMAIVQQTNQPQQQQFQTSHHPTSQVITNNTGNSSNTQQSGLIQLPTNTQPLLLNQMPVLVQQNTSQGVQLILRPQQSQLATPSLVIHNRPTQIQQQPQQLLRILNTNGAMLSSQAPTFIVSSQGNLIQQNIQGVKTSTSGATQVQQSQGAQRQPQQIINSHLLGQSVAQIQNLQLNGNITQIQVPSGQQFIQQLPAQFQQNLGSFNQIQPLTAIATSYSSPAQNANGNNEMVSSTNQIQFTSNQQNAIPMNQNAQIISPVATPQPQIISSDQSILTSPPSMNFNSQPQTAVILTSDKQIHEISSSQRQNSQNFSIIQQSGSTEMISMDMNQQQIQIQQNNNKKTTPKTPKKPKKSKKQKELEQKQAESAANFGNQAPTGKLDLANVMKLCGIMEDDDFMDGDDGIGETNDTQPEQQNQQPIIQVPSNNVMSENNSGDIMITIPGSTSDQPFTFTIPSSSMSIDGGNTIVQNSSGDGKFSNNVPFMIRINDGQSENGQPYTISIPNLNEDGSTDEHKIVETSNANPAICVPSFVNSVLNTQVTPTIQSQINEIQNQLMSLPSSKSSPTKSPRQKKPSTKKSKKNQEKPLEVPTQIGNIQISQIDGTNTKNNKNININNQIQIMPILEKTNNSNQQVIEKQKLHVPVMQQTISQNQNSNQNNNQQQHQQNSQGNHSHSSSGPSQVNINVQQNQLINVTNNLQMQVIANPQQQHNSNATPAPPPSSTSGHHHQVQTSTASLNTQNLIGNIINAQQNQASGNIIIQGGSFNQQQQHGIPANIQVNIQNQTIANNIITNPVQAQPSQQQTTAQNILSQLTGNLVLSLSEDGRLILRHDPNIPQDANSQMILQTILTGALGNVSLINEPLKTQNQTHQTIQGNNGKIHQLTSFQKNVIIETHSEPQSHTFNNVNQTHNIQGQVIQNVQQQIQVPTSKIDTPNQQQSHTVVMPNPNILKFVELPKIQPNQQLFSLNTITNEITQLSSNQTTAALSPMERLLIVPSGINAQQLAQCLSQGQIHFNNIGQAPVSDMNKFRAQITTTQQQQHQNTQLNIQKPVTPVIKKEPIEVKPKKGRGKKAKIIEESRIEIKKEPTIQSPPPPPMKMLSNNDTKFIKTTAITTSSTTTVINATTTKNTITISPNISNTKYPTKVENNKSIKSNSISVIPTTVNSNVAKNANTKIVKQNQQAKTTISPQMNTIVAQAAPPPLVSVNRVNVQTIQLTPQMQQSLKNVQTQIQQLSAKLQNKNLLCNVSAEVDPDNPAHNSPLPVLTNLNNDTEIFNALQRLFIEQQKILATGKKIFPTIPAVSPQMNNSSGTQILKNVQTNNVQTQQVFTNNIVGSAKMIQTTNIKQEPMTSSSNPPPLIVSAPIHIKSEFHPTNNIVTNAPPTGSIIISPKYSTTTPNRITTEIIVKEKIVEVKKDTVQQDIIDAETLKQNALAEARQKLKIKRSSLFERQICVDQEGCVNPDYKTSFTNKEDSVKRLIRYHCYYEEAKNEYDPKEEYEFEEKAKMYLASFECMKKKYQHLLMKQSQQCSPTSEHMMLDRLRVADLKDEIVSLQSELQTESNPTLTTIKKEITTTTTTFQINSTSNELTVPNTATPQVAQKQPVVMNQYVSLQEPSQILKAKQEQKIFENIRNEQHRFKVETVEVRSEQKSITGSQSSAGVVFSSQSKFNIVDKTKSDMSTTNKSHQHQHFASVTMANKPTTEFKKELEEFDIESEIRPNLIMKKNDMINTSTSPTLSVATTKLAKSKERKEREFSPLSDFFNKRANNCKTEVAHDPIYDDWFSVQKESAPKKKDSVKGKKCIDNELSDIFESHASPKTVEKQLDDLFSTNSKSNDLLSASSPLTEFFQVDSSQMNEKSVENRLEALFGEDDDESRKGSHQDLVETRLEQLFQGSVANDNDNSVMENPTFLQYKNNSMAYEIEDKNAQVSNPNKRHWSNGDCDIFGTSNSILFPSSPTSKRVCTTTSVTFDNKWIEDSFDFTPEINMISNESIGSDISKQRTWNGNMDNRDSNMIANIPTTSQFNVPNNHALSQNNVMQNNQSMDLMDAQLPNLSYEDPDDISRQVQNAIDSILNLQSSDPLSYSQLDSSFLELNTITSASSMNSIHNHNANAMSGQDINEYDMTRNDQIHNVQSFKHSNLPKRKFSTKMDAIGDCLIGGTNLDHSPSSLALTDSQGAESSASVGEFVNNLLNCEDKSITS